MQDRFKNKYSASSLRLQVWDYSMNGAYFVTICTQNKLPYFGEIVGGELVASALGQIAQTIWNQIPLYFQNMEPFRFVVMPDHIHGILIIHTPANPSCAEEADKPPILPDSGGFAGAKNPMFHQNLSRAIRWYKGRCSSEMRKICKDFAWQSGFYEHIIRDEIAFYNISNYIQNNPKNWNK